MSKKSALKHSIYYEKVLTYVKEFSLSQLDYNIFKWYTTNILEGKYIRRHIKYLIIVPQITRYISQILTSLVQGYASRNAKALEVRKCLHVR